MNAEFVLFTRLLLETLEYSCCKGEILQKLDDGIILNRTKVKSCSDKKILSTICGKAALQLGFIILVEWNIGFSLHPSRTAAVWQDVYRRLMRSTSLPAGPKWFIATWWWTMLTCNSAFSGNKLFFLFFTDAALHYFIIAFVILCTLSVPLLY